MLRSRGRLAVLAFAAIALAAADSLAAPVKTVPTKKSPPGSAAPPSKPKVGKAKTGPTRVETRTVYVPCWEFAPRSKPGTWSSRGCRPRLKTTARLSKVINLPVGKDRAKVKALRCRVRNDDRLTKLTFEARVGSDSIRDASVSYTGRNPPKELKGVPSRPRFVDPLSAPLFLSVSYRLDPVGDPAKTAASTLLGCFVDYTVTL